MSGLSLACEVKMETQSTSTVYVNKKQTNNFLKLQELITKAKEVGFLTPDEKSPVILRFLELPEKDQLKSLDWIQAYLNIISVKRSARKSLHKEGLWLNIVMGKLGWNLHHEFSTYFQDGDLVELYDLSSMKQIYRNMAFFKNCSYSIVDLAVYEWFRLWERPSRVEKLTFEKINAMISCGHPVPFEMEPFYLKETMFPNEKSLLITLEYLIPTFDTSGDIVGFIVTCRCQDTSKQV